MLSWFDQYISFKESREINCFSLEGVSDIIKYIANSILILTDRKDCSSGSEDAVSILRITLSGEIVWHKDYDLFTSINEGSLLITNNKSILVYGSSFRSPNKNLAIAIIAPNGQMVDFEIFENGSGQVGTEIAKCDNGGYMLQSKKTWP